MTPEEFKKSLAFGHKWEEKLCYILPSNGYKRMEGNFKYYDIEFYTDEGIKYYEVKADKLAYKTGNFGIEYECYKQPSGITTTTADYYAIFVVKPYDLYDLYIIPVQTIKDKINNNEYKRSVFGGDQKLAGLYIFDINTFSEYKYIPQYNN
jgi:hypothetical protein